MINNKDDSDPLSASWNGSFPENDFANQPTSSQIEDEI